ncbi:hypothetical protein OROGR_026245 [Orobanche gracilis]
MSSHLKGVKKSTMTDGMRQFHFSHGLWINGVMSVEWSTSSEWVLVTGGCDGAIRFWDIRRAGCFRVLDQSHSQFGRRPAILSRSTTNKLRAVNSKLTRAHCPTCLFEGKMLNPRKFVEIPPEIIIRPKFMGKSPSSSKEIN